MLTIFTIPKPFHGHISIIQKNAIQSWILLRPKCEILLFGNEKGIAEVASEFGIRHIPGINKNEFGTPLLNSVFNLAQKSAGNHLMVYINADIILMSDVISAIQRIKKPLFLMVGQCWDLDIKGAIQFDKSDWESKLRYRVIKEGRLHSLSGIDYFVFPSNLPHNLPPFAVGRAGWDNWLIYRARSLGIPVIDATEAVTVIHQDHDYVHSLPPKNSNSKKDEAIGDILKVRDDDTVEAQRNLKLAGGFSHMLTLRDADCVFGPSGLRRPKFSRQIFARLSLFYPWRLMLSITRRLHKLLYQRF